MTDQINEALKAYQNHDTQTAIAALDAAANLLRQARAEGLKKLLPHATRRAGPPTKPKQPRSASAMLGGGVDREPRLSQRRSAG